MKRRSNENDSRSIDRLDASSGAPKRERVVYVACEGERTEIDYLDQLSDTYGQRTEVPFRIQPYSKPKGMRPTETVESLIQRLNGRGSRQARPKSSHKNTGYLPDNSVGIDDGGDDYFEEAWALFDRDRSDRDDDLQRAFALAAANNIEVGFSSPSFDLWLLLHFQAFSGTQQGNCSVVVEKLRRAHPAFSGFDRRNNSKGLTPQRFAALLEDEGVVKAVRHARSLVNACPHGDCKAGRAQTDRVRSGMAESVDRPQWSARSGHSAHCSELGRDPSSDVWRLLVNLGIVAIDGYQVRWPVNRVG